MGRGKFQKQKRDRKKSRQPKQSKFKKKKYQIPRDMKHTEQYAQYKQKIEKEKKKKIKPVEEDEYEAEVVQDPLSLLLSTFKSNKNKFTENSAIDSEDSSDDSDENNMEVEATEEIEETEDHNLMTDKCDASNETVTKIDCLVNNTDEETDISGEDEIEDEKALEAEVNNKNDPFHIHLNYDLSQDLLDSVSSTPMKCKTSKLYWPVLKNLKVEIPISSDKQETTNENTEPVQMIESVEYAKEYSPPVLIQTVDYDKLYIKSQIQKNIFMANKKHTSVANEDFSQLQKELFSVMNNYQDLFYCERTLQNGEEVRFTYCLHAVNHILKTRLKILHHTSKAHKKSKDDILPDEFRDQGLVRPKVIIIAPFRNSCLRIVDIICSILLSDNKANVINKKRFYDEFKGSELLMPKKNPKPEDYEQLFRGNIDDNFRIGLSVTKKSVKLYSDFYSSDIIVASPLGLRMVIGAEGDKEQDFDFLASVEILVLDQAEVFLMQNWDHLLLIFDHLHMQPKESHGTDFSRVRSWALNGWTKFYRQTLLFSSVASSELNAVFNRRCFNYAGKIRVVNPVEDGSICRVVVPLCHVFQKFKSDSATNALDDRFRVFTEKIIPQYKDPAMTGVLIYIPSYFDYVRIRNYLKQSDYNFVQICEYSKDSKVARARDMFYHNEAKILLYSERFHFFRRINLKGIRHLIFYQPPTIPHFYAEMCNLMQETNQNRFLINDHLMTVSVLYCKYDVHQLSGIVKTARAAKIISSDKDIHMFSTS
ncbi:hypothetical protein RUM44_001241 [Polyplax serrata]|uniref:U3 small nucleolar RNA-associated protein 25 homolog n=1 Tax=Polyplax serrata TaxID=468196 RepID=A0ABR1AJH0_POLSC